MHDQVADIHAKDLGRVGAHHKMALTGRPELTLTIRAKPGQAGMGLDVALMHRGRLETHLDYRIGLGKSGLNIA